MKIFNYDKETKELLNIAEAQKHPLKEGEFLFPPNCTTIIPPSVGDNETVIFNGEYWNIVPDFRGLDQINLQTKEISEVVDFGKIKQGFMLYSDFLKTNEYKEYEAKINLQLEKEKIIEQIELLDKKRLRALCEPSVKDEKSGLTWLEYYNTEIKNLRASLNGGKYGT